MPRWEPMLETLARSRPRALVAYAYLLTRDTKWEHPRVVRYPSVGVTSRKP
jgi:hypothetical protein